MAGTILFDLDGTLVDSAPDLRAALNRLMAARGLPPFALPEVVAMVGDGAKALVERALAARGQTSTRRRWTPSWRTTPEAAVETRPYAGIPEVLDALAAAGWRLAVCTNKPEAAARELLEALGPHAALRRARRRGQLPGPEARPGHLLGDAAPRRRARAGRA
jgi:phosphoglycolate phosphatase